MFYVVSLLTGIGFIWAIVWLCSGTDQEKMHAKISLLITLLIWVLVIALPTLGVGCCCCTPMMAGCPVSRGQSANVSDIEGRWRSSYDVLLVEEDGTISLASSTTGKRSTGQVSKIASGDDDYKIEWSVPTSLFGADTYLVFCHYDRHTKQLEATLPDGRKVLYTRD